MSETKVNAKDISFGERVRKDYGDLDDMCNSIKEFGLLQPIVITKDFKLIAGGRRLSACLRMGKFNLVHSEDFIFKDEVDPIRLQAMELEENLKRKDLSWQEQCIGKQKLLEAMKSIHGEQLAGRPSNTSEGEGFSVRKLSSMLGESVGTTSQDIQIAKIIQKFPQLAQGDSSKTSVLRKVGIINSAASMLASKQYSEKESLWTLYEGDFRKEMPKVESESVDLIITDPPYGTDIQDQLAENAGFASFNDSKENVRALLTDFAKESYRVLRHDRYMVIWFGFSYYEELLQNLSLFGFNVIPIPFIWYKKTHRCQTPYSRYGNAYENAIIACKGTPKLMRPGQPNVWECPPVPLNERIHQAQKPVALMEKFILDMTVEGATVLDCFAGSGATGVASVKNKRRVILIEENKGICQLIEGRMSNI